MKNLIYSLLAVLIIAVGCTKSVDKPVQQKIDTVSLLKVANELMQSEQGRRKRTTPITTINQTASLTVTGIHTAWNFGNIPAPPADYIIWTQLYFLTPDINNTLVITSGMNYVYQDGYYDATGTYLTEKDFPLTMPVGTYAVMVGHITLNGMLVFSNTANLVIP